MLNEEIARYEKITGEDASKVSVERIGAFLDGYDKATENYNWHHRPEGGWSDETLPEVGANITIASVFCLKSGEYIEYNSVTMNERCECYGNDDYVCEMKDVDMWMYIPSVKEGAE